MKSTISLFAVAACCVLVFLGCESNGTGDEIGAETGEEIGDETGAEAGDEAGVTVVVVASNDVTRVCRAARAVVHDELRVVDAVAAVKDFNHEIVSARRREGQPNISVDRRGASAGEGFWAIGSRGCVNSVEADHGTGCA